MDKPFSKKYRELLDIKRILRKTKNKNLLTVTLKEGPIKGVGLYATKMIKKGEIIAHYKITIFDEKTYKSPTKYVYSFSIYNKSGKSNNKLIGDIDLDSIPPPINDITYWGLFANEPSGKQVENAEIDMNLHYNYKNRKRVKIGSTIVYDLVAIKNIKKGDEVVWYYGEDYERDYEVNID
jgi:hypothetical protein